MPRATKTQAKPIVALAMRVCPYARERERMERREQALASHAPQALALAQQGLALAEAWAAFERDALATDARLAPIDQPLDHAFGTSAQALRNVCDVMRDRASRLLHGPPPEEEKA